MCKNYKVNKLMTKANILIYLFVKIKKSFGAVNIVERSKACNSSVDFHRMCA